MAIYYIGKSQSEISNISIFSGSETIFGSNENENYAMFSLADESTKELNSKQLQTAYEALRFGMEKFRLFDEDATFVFSDKELMQKVMHISFPELQVTQDNVKLVENLQSFTNNK